MPMTDDFSVFSIKLINAQSVWDGTIAGVLFCLVILVLALLIVGRRGRGNPTQEKSDIYTSGVTRVGEIIEARVVEGVEKSLMRCTAIESELIAQKATADDLEGSQDMSVIEADLGFIRWYRLFHEQWTSGKSGDSEMRRFIGDVHDALPLERDGYRELYKQLLSIAEAFRGGSLQPILSAVGSTVLPSIRSSDVYFVCLLEVLHAAAAACRNFLRADGTEDRNLKLEELRRALHQVTERVRRVDADNSARKLVPPEFSLLLSNLPNTVVLVVEEARTAIAGPSFEISLPDASTELTVESRYLHLNFLLEDSNRVAGLQIISVTPRCQSSELSYSGEPLRRIDFQKHVAEIPFTFGVYIFDNSEYDSTPKIVFDIEYSLFGLRAVRSVEIALPKLIARPRLKNPFRDGELGRGLPGDSKLFVGRHELLSEIATELLNIKPRFYWLHGLARTGKSSVMNQLSGNPRWLSDRYTPIEIHAQASQGPSAFFLHVYHLVKDAIDLGGGGSTTPHEDFLRKEVSPAWRPVTELLRLNEALLVRQKRRLLVLIDEVQDIARSDRGSEGSDKYTTIWYQFPEFIKVLRDQYDSAAAVVVCGLWNLTDFDTINYNWTQQLGGRMEVRKVTNLLPWEADDLIVRQFEPCGVHLSDPVLLRIRKYTSGHPFLQMLMGYYLFERLTENGKLRSDREVSSTDVDAAASGIPTDTLKFIWADPWIRDKPQVRLFLGALGQKSAEAGERNTDFTALGSFSVDTLSKYLYETFQIQFPHLDFESVIGDLHAQQGHC